MTEAAAKAKTEKPAPVAPAAPKGMTPGLHSSRLKLTEGARQGWTVDVLSGTGLDTLLEPTYWRHIAYQLKTNDFVECLWEDGTREVWLRVQFISPVGVKVSVILDVPHEAPDNVVLSDNYLVDWKGPGQRWAVLRTDTKAIVKDGFHLKSEAFSFLANHLREMKR